VVRVSPALAAWLVRLTVAAPPVILIIIWSNGYMRIPVTLVVGGYHVQWKTAVQALSLCTALIAIREPTSRQPSVTM
jgi:hypothetical protein